MRIIKSLDNTEIQQVLEDFYKQFETGFEFEDFLKPFLESLGLSEVEVTKKTGDDGIDLHAILHGVIDGLDDVSYYVQAKRYKPTSHIPPKEIDALRGNLKTNEKGLFITTAKVSQKAKDNAVGKDPNRPVIVIDGLDLINRLIDKEIGFSFKPVFSPEAIKEYIGKGATKGDSSAHNSGAGIESAKTIKKRITNNDIRAGIISIPSGIISEFNNKNVKRQVTAIVNGHEYSVTFCPSRNYLGGVTQIFKDFDLKSSDGSFSEKDAYWSLQGESFIISI